MSGRAADLTSEIGKRYGSLTVVKRALRVKGGGRSPQWECLCDCGKTRVTAKAKLKANGPVSCGCHRKLIAAQQEMAADGNPATDRRGYKYVSKVVDETGNRHGMLVALSQAPPLSGKAMWNCRCDCGKQAVISGDGLRQGKNISCGCKRRLAIADLNKTHGKSGSSIYNIWMSMKQRCLDPKCKAFKNYGGRGIRVSEDWMVFENFYRDMGDHPEGKWLERVDNNGPYSKENCAWVPQIVQMQNQRRTIRVEVGGAQMSLLSAARVIGVKYWRIKRLMQLSGVYAPGLTPFPLSGTQIIQLKRGPNA